MIPLRATEDNLLSHNEVDVVHTAIVDVRPNAFGSNGFALFRFEDIADDCIYKRLMALL